MTFGLVMKELDERARERGSEVNVATMTIVVFFEDAAIGELARDRIHTLAAKYPSRVVLLDGTQSEAAHRVEGADWIELGAKGAGAETLRAATNALRLPETPVVLLWIAPGIGDDERFCALSRDARTIVYNSSLVDVGHDALCRLVTYAESHPELPIADIAYLRLAPWQESVAILFDGEEAAALLDIAHIEITCGSEPEAFYLLGWLASRLGWKPRSADTMTARSGNQISFAIRREGEPRRISRIVVNSNDSSFVAEVDGSAETIQLSVTGSRTKPPRPRAINNPGVAALVERAILSSQRDRMFQSSLATAGEILACAPSRA
jgi:glucose-6-phosphate dehydrogenase assembly protein OpcA